VQDYCFAFVDLETTGVSAAADRITEIGVVLIDNGAPSGEWSSLVDPGVPIPPAIQSLTGITNDMVRQAPAFRDIAVKLREMLKNRIVVAHNARFDYGFLKNEYRRLGERLTAELLCTVRLSRRLFPQFSSHSLDSILARHRLPGAGRHRALGDARLLAQFVERLWAEEDRQQLSEIISSLLRQPARPPHLPDGTLEVLPESPGVYVFRGETGHPLYVGKARNLRQRVRGHFYADSQNSNDSRLSAEVHRIDVEETAGELSALLREIELIKSIAPLHNVALRKRKAACFIRPVDPGCPPRILHLDTIDPCTEPDLYGPFATRQRARATLAELGRSHQLCDRALGLWSRDGPCFSHQIRRCHGYCVAKEAAVDHHRRLLTALEPLRFPAWPFDGPVTYTERDEESGKSEELRFDRWRMAGPGGLAEFDVDVFRVLRRRVSRLTLIQH
jgi:DNA polymerase III subunit epsilon